MMIDALIVDPFLGEMSCGTLAQELGAECYAAPASHTINWPEIVSPAIETLTSSPNNWRTVIGIDLGAIVAVHLVHARKANKAILVEPFLGHLDLTRTPELASHVRSYNLASHTDHQLTMMENTLPRELANGRLSDTSIEVMFRHRSDPAEYETYLRALQRNIHAREPLVFQPSPDVAIPHAGDWMKEIHDLAGVQVWFSSTMPLGLADLFRETLPPGTVTQKDWPRHAWMTQPKRVAQDLMRVCSDHPPDPCVRRNPET